MRFRKERTKPKPKNRSSRGRNLSESELRAQSEIRVVSGDTKSGKWEKKMRLVLRDSFTHEELRKIGPVDVRFGKVAYGNRAAFYGTEHGDRAEIIFDPRQIEDDDITHEFVHSLKDADKDRRSWAAAGNVKQRMRWQNAHHDMRNTEEATVVAEAAIRTKKPVKNPSGYYRDIPGIGNDRKKRKEAYNEDRLILLEEKPGTRVGKTRGVQGKEAIEKLNRNFTKTNISKKTYRGRSAVRSYEKLKVIK